MHMKNRITRGGRNIFTAGSEIRFRQGMLYSQVRCHNASKVGVGARQAGSKRLLSLEIKQLSQSAVRTPTAGEKPQGLASRADSCPASDDGPRSLGCVQPLIALFNCVAVVLWTLQDLPNPWKSQ